MDILGSDSDFEGYSETSDSDDQDETESAYGGHAQCILSSLDESIGRIDDYLAFERGFVPGDIVCSVKDPSGQMGRVIDVDMVVDLESSNGGILKDVNSKKLLKVRSFGEGDYVVHGSWLGRVVKVHDLVTVLLDDGTKHEVSTIDPERLVPVSTGLLEDVHYVYYPGQRVRINYSTSFKSSRLLSGIWHGGRNEGTVCMVKVGSIIVNWITSVMVGCGIVPTTPPHMQEAESLTLLSCFPHTNWQLGDWCKLSPDYLENLNIIAKEKAPPSINRHGPSEMKNIRMKDHEQTYVISKTKTKVDVLWQDGNHSVGLDLQILSPVNTIGDHDFWPGQFVLEKAISEDAPISAYQRLGIVKTFHAMERIVDVKWVALNQTDGSQRGFTEETVSAYELIEHPDYSYCLGDVVFQLPQFESSIQALAALQNDIQRKNHEYPPVKSDHCSLQLLMKDRLLKNFNIGDHDDHTFCYLSCIGNVIGFKDGRIEVSWASGDISKVEPCEIFGIDKFDVATSIPVSNEEPVEGTVDKVIAEQDRQSLDNKKEKELLEMDFNDPREDCLSNALVSGALLFPHAAFGFLVNVATRYFGFHGSSSLFGSCFDSHDRTGSSNLEQPDLEATERLYPLKKTPDKMIPKTEDVLSDVDSIQFPTQLNLATQVQVKGTNLFKKFDIVDNNSDHHFATGVGKGLELPQVKRSWFKKVQQEWNILEKDLPDTISVRVYEERIDLLRASIVGAAGTPYQDALFFFDICFPPEYPHEPPMVHYISGGLRLNPNLYESGKVCLSLLKTWTGTGTEVWNPESSTILQLLLSLQALVLNDKPYFNEAGYDKQIGRAEGERNSVTYNENAFLLSRKSMLYQLRNPPKHFEALVKEHFSSRSHQILLVCKGHMDETEGYEFGCGETTVEGQKGTSTGFKIMLAKLFTKLISVFMERGIDCSQFLDQTTLALEPSKEST